MKNNFYLLLVLISVLAPSVQAQECVAETQPRKLMTFHPSLADEFLDVDKGRYTAILNNGDSIMASFAICDLGLRAHYISVRPLEDKELKTTLVNFMTKVLPSEVVVNKVVPQLKAVSSIELEQSLVFSGLNDSHRLVVSPSSSPLFATEIHYEWIPPEY